jgi:hypothetical protein
MWAALSSTSGSTGFSGVWMNGSLSLFEIHPASLCLSGKVRV